MPSRCAVPKGVSGRPQAKRIPFKTFSAALRWFLKDAGYIR